jgi:predicted metal-dependent hydrolase
MKTKWASYSPNGRITLDSGLLDLSRGFGEYVILHELLHIKIPNHGKLFKSLMSAYMPNWEKISQIYSGRERENISEGYF